MWKYVSYLSVTLTRFPTPFNEHFSTIGPSLAPDISSTSDEESIYLENITENYNKFCSRPTTTGDVFTHPNRLSKTKATGLDNISARLIHECADIISGPLHDLFNKSLISGIFPDDWKCARVSPLFKQGWIKELLTYLSHFRSRQSVREDCASVIQLLK